MPDITLTTGADTSGVATGLAQLRNEVNTAGEEIKSSFVSAFSLTNIAALASVEGLRELVEKAHEIHHESERFGIDAQELQTIANAARENGVSLEQVAQVMNRLAIVTEKQFSAIESLGISTDYFLKLNPAERFYAIADALQKNGVNTETYTAAVTLLGRRAGGELIPVLAQGRQAIVDLGTSMGVMSERQIADLDRLHGFWERFKQALVVVGAFFISSVEEPMEKGILRLSAMFNGLGNQMVHDAKSIALALTGQFAAAWEEHKKGLEIANQIHDAEVKAEQAIDNAGHAAVKTSQDVVEGMEGIAGAAGSAASGVKAVGAATEDLGAIEERNRIAALDAEGKLQDLLAQRQGLLETLNSYSERGLISDEEELKLKTEIATLDGQIGALQREESTEQDSLNKKLLDELDAVNKQKDALQEQAAEARFIAAGHTDIAQAMQKEYQTQQQIDGLNARINDAWATANEAWSKMDEESAQVATNLANALTQLRDMLQAQKDLVAQQQAYNRAATATRNTTSALRGGNIGGSGLDQTDLTNMPVTQALVTQDSRYGLGMDYAQAYAAHSGHLDDATIAQYLKQWATMTSFGAHNLSGVQQAELDRIKNWLVSHPANPSGGAAPDAAGTINVPPISNDLGNFEMVDTGPDPLTQRDNWAKLATSGVAPPPENFLNKSVFTDMRAAFGVGGFLHNDIAGIIGPGGFLGGSGATPPIATPSPQPVTIDPGDGFDLGTTNNLLSSIDQKITPPPG